MRLLELFKEVKEENLTKEQLEQYFSELSQLSANISLNLAQVKKEEALFMAKNAEKSIAQRKVEFRATGAGQKLIDLKEYKIASNRVLDSLKTRIYSKL